MLAINFTFLFVQTMTPRPIALNIFFNSSDTKEDIDILHVFKHVLRD